MASDGFTSDAQENLPTLHGPQIHGKDAELISYLCGYEVAPQQIAEVQLAEEISVVKSIHDGICQNADHSQHSHDDQSKATEEANDTNEQLRRDPEKRSEAFLATEDTHITDASGASNELAKERRSCPAKSTPIRQASRKALRVALPPTPSSRALRQLQLSSPGPVGLKQGAEPSPRKGPSPLRWFPRTKKESYLERKIRLLQEKEGISQATLDETLDTAPSKLSRIEREKQEAAIAAREAAESRHAALAEACWYRILDAAGIPSIAAVEAAKEAEQRAANALTVATKLGVVLRDQGAGSPRAGRKGGYPEAPQAVPGGAGIDDAILASVQNVWEVEKEIVMAVKAALALVANIREEDGIMDMKDEHTAKGKAAWRDVDMSGEHEVQNDAIEGTKAPVDGNRGLPVQRQEGEMVETEYGAHKGDLCKHVELQRSDDLQANTGEEKAYVNAEGGLMVEGNDGEGNEKDRKNENESVCQDVDVPEKDELQAKSETRTTLPDDNSTIADVQQASASEVADISDALGGGEMATPNVNSREEEAYKDAGSQECNGQVGQKDSAELSHPTDCEMAADGKENAERPLAGESEGEFQGINHADSMEESASTEASSEKRTKLKKVKVRPPWQDVELSEISTEDSPLETLQGSPVGISSGPNPHMCSPVAKAIMTSPMRSPYGSPYGSPLGSPAGSPYGSPRAGAATVIEEGRSLHEKIISRLQEMEPDQRAALASIVATREMVNDLLVELRDVRETGVRRISEGGSASGGGSGLGDILKKHVSKLEREKAAVAAARAQGAEEAKVERATGGRTGKHSAPAEDLGMVMKKHVSRFERDLAAAKAAARLEKKEPRAHGQQKGAAVAAPGEGLGDTLVKHKSRLQREKEAAQVSSTNSGKTATGSASGANGDSSSRGGEGDKRPNRDASKGAEAHAESFGELVFKKPMSRLERERVAAADAAKENGGDLAPRLGKGKKGTENGAQAGGLGDVLVKHKGALQTAIDAAKLQTREESTAHNKQGRVMASAARPGLGESLVKHKSRLQREIEKAQGEDGQRGAKAANERKTTEPGEGLGEVLVKHTSRLQREKEAAAWMREGKAGSAEPEDAERLPEKKKAELGGGLSDVFVKKMSRLEREKETAAEEAATGKGRFQARKMESDPWEGQGLGQTLKKHVSKLERDKAAWIKAEEEAKRRSGT